MTAQGLAASPSWGSEKIVYRLFCVFIIIIITVVIIIGSSSSISFVVLLKCQPTNFTFYPFSSPSHWGRRGGVSKQLSSA